MVQFFPSRWVGNQWPSIEMEPVETILFQLVLCYLADSYQFQLPPLVHTLDGCFADFELLGVEASLDLDNWSLSFACPDEAVRDQVLLTLQELPPDFFELIK
ncbi:hypothetical protein [Hymenobacter wooponensis]|uniref:DUF3630 family protein n=1 Tax=Hymenobacter wooponensis TaxID=1525360 RepID=A0A4Z0MML8_9BACT|nr:hypothetical protein [Hymenobacter wooponensis]TGD80487.1 hypothetical protein EU557_11680 [Hymenobacter wooponensis]